MPGAHRLREGETLIGRAPACDVVINSSTISRQHARVRLTGGRVFVSDAGSTYGTLVNGSAVKGEHELVPGDSFVIGHLQFTLTRDVQESEVLSDSHQVFEESHTIVRRVDRFDGDAASPPAATPAVGLMMPAGSATSVAHTPASGLPTPGGFPAPSGNGMPASQAQAGLFVPTAQR